MNKYLTYLPTECLMAFCIILLFTWAFAVSFQRDNLKKQAVERGFAEWVCDSSGNTTWRWKETK